MKVEHQYICEKCGAVYKEQNKALYCEDHHEVPFLVVDLKYSKGRKYPYSVNIIFNDNRRFQYTNSRVRLLEESDD